MIRSELFATAGILVWPFAALLSGGLLTAVGLGGRPGRLGQLARAFGPSIPWVPTPPAQRPELHITGHKSETERAHILLVVPWGDAATSFPAIDVVLTDKRGQEHIVKIDQDQWNYFQGGRNQFWWTKATATQLTPATAYTVNARPDATGSPRYPGAADRLGSEIDSSFPFLVHQARVATLPPIDATAISVVVGSCAYRGNEHSDNLPVTYDELVGDDLAYHFWLGDQVYLDRPWRTGFRQSEIADQVSKRYLDTWEIGATTPDPEDDRHCEREADKRFGYLLRRSSNWFLPDDHEFWGAYPKVSYRTMPKHAFVRHVRNLATRPDNPYEQGQFGQTAADSVHDFPKP